MPGGLVRRQAALAGVALIGALGAIALTRAAGDDPGEPPASVVQWTEARVGIFVVAEEPTDCGLTLEAGTVGVAHPVLPCGARLVLAYRGRQAQAEVVARGPVDTGRAFDVSPALAEELGLAGEADVRWRFAG
ncbi:MAG TPA: hypothetical protein VK915_04705 [Gaiellaceae bacterium]|nr:hypothetical protein [Gaiellaceae bacterium]